MKTKQTRILLLTAIVLALSLIGISCSKDSSSPVDSGTNATNAPASPSPADGATLQPTSLGLHWSCSPSSGETLTYDVYFGTTNPPTTTVATNVSQSTLAQAALSNLTVYYWQVVAKNSKGTTTRGPVWQFTTGIAGMIPVQGGSFDMGSNTIGGDPEKPVHSVTLSGYFIGMFEVTQKEWREVVVWKQASAPTPLNPNPTTSQGDSLPVSNVSWDDIQTWLGYLNEKEGLASSPKKYRLPTEAEWEFAARGGIKTKGFQYSGSDNLSDVAWYSGNSGKTLQIVGTKTPNELGIYDMSGNAFEWCNDYYGSYSSSAQSNPTGPSSGTYRCLRGGCTKIGFTNCYTVYRDYESPSTRLPSLTGPTNDMLGFRYARTQ